MFLILGASICDSILREIDINPSAGALTTVGFYDRTDT